MTKYATRVANDIRFQVNWQTVYRFPIVLTRSMHYFFKDEVMYACSPEYGCNNLKFKTDDRNIDITMIVIKSKKRRSWYMIEHLRARVELEVWILHAIQHRNLACSLPVKEFQNFYPLIFYNLTPRNKLNINFTNVSEGLLPIRVIYNYKRLTRLLKIFLAIFSILRYILAFIFGEKTSANEPRLISNLFLS